MVLSSEDIRKRLKKKYGINNIWLLNPKWYLLPYNILEKIVYEDIKKEKTNYIKGIFECENYAYGFINEIRKMQAIHYRCKKYMKQHHKWAVGVASGTCFNGETANHTLNIAICQEGDFWFDPVSRKIFKHNANDKPYKIDFI